MHILVGETRVDIINYGVQRDRITGRLILTVTMLKENITATELDTLCTTIKDTAPEIIVYGDDGEMVQKLVGFALMPVFGLTKNGTWEVVVENKSELEYQYQTLLEENAVLKAQTQTLEEQNQMLVDCILEMSTVVYA